MGKDLFTVQTLSAHSPPANLNDLSKANKEIWSEKRISAWMAQEIDGGIPGPCGKPRTALSQFFDGTVTAFNVDQTPIATIHWTAFPNRIKQAYPDDNTRWAIADYSRMVQDEYCEWSVLRDENNNIISVTFTCEGPEYWQFIADYQDGETEGTNITALYNQLNPQAGNISTDELYLYDDKTGAKVYNPMNFYNCASTTGFIAHLIHPSNTLGAEIDIVAQATVLRVDKQGHPINSQIPLIQCSKYGQPKRNSDPFIGITVNNAARGGNSLSIADPVGLYIKSFDANSFTLDGQPISEIDGLIKWTRGDIKEGMGLRFTISIPADYKGKSKYVSDIYDSNAGQTVYFAAQFADYIQIGVGAVVIPDYPVAQAENCPCDHVATGDRPRGALPIGNAPEFDAPPTKQFRGFRRGL